MINERYREDRERRRLGSLTVFSGPTHSGKTKKLEAEAERAQRQGRRSQRLAGPADANQLLDRLDPAAELVTVDDAQQYDDRLVEVLNDLATIHRVDIVVAGWELDYTGQASGPLPELMCAADFALKLDDGVCAQPGCRNLASRTQRFHPVNGTPERFLPVCRRHHTPEARALSFQEVWFDEPQFLGPEIVSLADELADRGRHVIVAGLDLDFLARPFGPMPLLAAYADRLTKLQASCQYPGCGSRQATRTQRLVDGEPASADSPLVVIGGAATYEARCRHHHRLGVTAKIDAEPVPMTEDSTEL